ncbi:filamentous hemagglutinin outer membrane protein [Herbaspirillum rubrisubalbicans M1]|uniref:hemagglutinin repeat-containing protein n=1 Tax=Herbaspirillum rubrisubalbicans TaxID=80842 RepID=UPI00073A9435|nr:hemagglutinin repeat-containing protein [Herbaspirillum rubrisubalbicans]ALU88770.1 filamentous hemagglutinin outer membrane protein [Herbaspirillum rubrisubalbicans M1]
MLRQLGQLNQPNAAIGVRQLGDGFYEQQLVQRQIQQITGQRYLAGYSSNEAQYQALMNAGLQVAQAQRYTVGVALTDAQVAALKTDIVWLVKQTVTLADGSTQEVLVPQVYVHASNVEVTGQGTLIAGNDVAFQAAQDIVNSGGTIAARKGVSLAGANLQNLGGRISGADVQVAAAQDINNIGGTIDARNTLVATAGRDINSASTTVATANAVTSGTNINQNASMSVSEANGSLTAVAGRDINLKASGTSADNVTLVAQRDVNLATVHETSQEKLAWDNDNRAEVNRDNAIGSTVQGKDISVTAGRDINAQAVYVNAEGSLAANAGNNVNIGTDVSTANARDQHKKTDAGGVLSSRTVTTDDSSSERINQGTTLSGNTVVVRAGKDINVTGSNVVATQGLGMAAGNDVNIVAAVDSSTKNNFRKETTSGVMGAGFGVTIGTREQSHDGKSQGQTASASTIGSTDGNVSIVAGNRYTQVGSDVMAPKGDIDIAAKSVEIRAAEQASRTETEDKYKQSGLTVAVTSPVISAMQTVDQMVESSGKTKNGRVKALAAATAGMSLYSAAGEMQKAGSAEGGSNIGISATIGSSQNGSRSEQNTVTQRGSTVASGGNMSIRATGDGANSNITIAGSDINAKGNLALKADNDINLIAAQNSDEQHSTRSSSSWGVGITAQIGSQSKLGITANAAGSRGKSDGKDVSNVMTQVRSGGQIKIDSGRDTNLIGATVSGEQVQANVGRDLNIASVQDTSTFKSRDQSIGGSATIGYGSSASISASRSRVDADYASVGQQAGIMAGNGGFQINVKGNTDLKGAQIASTDQAVEQGRNSLTTGTLTSSDIQNRSQYSAESQSASAGTSGGKPGGGIGIGNASGSETSVTRSGVSGAAVTITDAQAQQARTGQSADQAVASLDTSVRTGKDSSNSLAKNWDGNQLREDVEAQAKITQAFGQQAAKAIGDYAGTKQRELEQAAKTASLEGDETSAANLRTEAAKWSEGGEYRVGAHTAIGLLGGGVGGALGAAASASLMPDIAKQIEKLKLPPALETAVSLAAAAGIGAAVGGDAGAASAYNVDLNNRILHKEEPAALNRLAKGKTQEEQKRLVDAVCALTHCSAGIPDNDPMKAVLTASEQRGQNYMLEQSQLKSEGLFTYGSIDRLVDILTRYQVSNRSVGAVQGVSSTALGVTAIGASCSTVLACGLGAVVGGTALDYGYAGFKQLWAGDIVPTYGEQVLQSFGLSPTMAALLYGGINIAATGGSSWVSQAGKIPEAKLVSPPNSVPIKGPGGGASLADDNLFNLTERELVPSTSGSLIGKFEVAPKNAPVDQLRSIQRQNEAAETLSKSGLQVENLPNTGRPGANPDLKINGELADVYAPTTGNPKSIRDKIIEKVNTQAPTVVVNLADSPLTASDVAQYIQRNPVGNMKSLFIMKSGKVYFLEAK